jgi:glyceraldehyde-3-phosphate dehydrogenase/erythrose-4-phosphate dehydrogenase
MEAWGELKVTTRICMSVAFCTTLAIAWVWTLLTEPGGKVEMLTVCAKAAPETTQAALMLAARRRNDFIPIVSS